MSCAGTAFSNEAKAKAFDSISKLFFEHNFGKTPKSEIDALMFGLYFENLVASSQPLPSDYQIGLFLGVTASKVASMRQQYYLRNPGRIDWKEELRKSLGNDRFDVENDSLVIPIENRFVYDSVKDGLSEKGAFCNTSFDKSLLTVKLRFVPILLLLVFDNDREGIRTLTEAINKIYDSTFQGKDSGIPAKDAYDKAEQIAKTVKDFSETILNISNAFSNFTSTGLLSNVAQKIAGKLKK